MKTKQAFFEKEEKHHTGNVWIEQIADTPASFGVHLRRELFEPMARTFWHQHTQGQLLAVEQGVCWIQIKGERIKTLEAGDRFFIPAQANHWLGAAEHQFVTLLSIERGEKGRDISWGAAVSDSEYLSQRHTLDLQTQEVVDKANTLTPPQTIEDIRQAAIDTIPMAGEPEHVANIENRVIETEVGEIPIRIYNPSIDEGGKLPIFLFYHGGGFIRGTLDTHDPPLRTIANNTPCVVVSVDYKLSPEHKFPIAHQEALAAALWLHDHAEEIGGHSSRITIGGDSAGGNLAIYVTHQLKERYKPFIKAQLLLYPATDATMGFPSMEEFATGYRFTKAAVAYSYDSLLPEDIDRTDPRVSPIFQEDLSNLPPAFVGLAGCDPLRDDGLNYAKRLIEAGVQAQVVVFENTMHGFFTYPGVMDSGKMLVSNMVDYLKRILTMSK